MKVSSVRGVPLSNLVVVRDLLIVVGSWTLYIGLGRARRKEN